MNCLYCKSPAAEQVRPCTYRRGSREVEVAARYWECSMCPDSDGDYPAQWCTPDQMKANDDAAKAIWKTKYAEEMPLSPAQQERERPKPPAPYCAPGHDRHCFHRTNLFHHVRSVQNGYHDCNKCCWCGWKWCRSTTHAKQPEGHGPFIMDAQRKD
jgi:hypothetical protein